MNSALTAYYIVMLLQQNLRALSLATVTVYIFATIDAGAYVHGIRLCLHLLRDRLVAVARQFPRLTQDLPLLPQMTLALYELSARVDLQHRIIQLCNDIITYRLLPLGTSLPRRSELLDGIREHVQVPRAEGCRERKRPCIYQKRICVSNDCLLFLSKSCTSIVLQPTPPFVRRTSRCTYLAMSGRSTTPFAAAFEGS